MNQRTKKQRVITFNCTISAIGNLSVCCIKVADRFFTAYHDRAKIIHVDEKLYVSLYLCGTRENTLTYWIYSEVIVPEIIDVRNRILNQSEQTKFAEKFGIVRTDKFKLLKIN